MTADSRFARGLLAALTSAAAAAAIAVAGAARAADAEPLHIIVGYAPGGAADSLARLYAEQLRQDGHGTVVVENRPGASARLALDYVKRSRPDGKTVFIGPSPLFTIFPLTYKKLGYDADKDLVPAAVLTDVPTVVAAGVQQPYRNMKEYLEWAKRNPAGASLGLATIGSAGHLGTVALGKAAGIAITPAAYRGAAPMLVDVVSGNVSIGWDAVASMMPLYKGGKLQFLGVSGTRRAKALPEVPTMKEQGFSQYEYATSWYGVFVPAGTQPDVVAKVEKMFIAASGNAATAGKLEALGLEVVARPGQEAKRRIQVERAAWKPIVEATGFVAED
ncbi:tripartite tricarboxylate transporter substrate-binding protein [Cupriavidus consociatus]|uniref:tripartite tricarboxylate transporter substrate-binding protein n=1 Tax=Cupriavidus consociatus TaxID=2821357 RepID=UPI001AE77AFE|nr:MULTISPECIES: tripartite tricarboxylate transporter substrate-binding protein [unclassified Cupriavidus]MBP0623886.1 tripartite tricarboxylate transporter substrate binding protein [Cupriavidus sp. LEh25]MDK2660593.1 tripartite tricarboxylate transporter substrate-binding protein [Cupriavidus sp. LEh21]